MTIDVYSAAGQKKGTLDLPKNIFEATVRQGLMHQAVMLQQSNRRNTVAHAKGRSEVEGSTRKLYGQKHTGRARRGSIRSPLLRGGGKAFGPRKIANFVKDMPRTMRHVALCSCLSYQAKRGAIIGLESYPDTIKTKEMSGLLKKLPIEYGRRVLMVLPEKHEALWLSARNIPGVKTLQYSYLNPDDVLLARHIIFLTEAVKKTEEWLGKKSNKLPKMQEEEGAAAEKTPAKPKTPKRKTAAAAAKKPSKKSPSNS